MCRCAENTQLTHVVKPSWGKKTHSDPTEGSDASVKPGWGRQFLKRGGQDAVKPGESDNVLMKIGLIK